MSEGRMPRIIAAWRAGCWPVRRRLPLWLGWLLAVLVAAGFASLGRWQLQRMHQKQAMLDGVASVLANRNARPLAVAEDATRANGYDWAAGEGVFAEGPAVLLDNQMHAGRYGVRAYRVFRPAGAVPLLVDLGWMPVGEDRRMPVVPRPALDRVAGLLMPSPSHGLFVGSVPPAPQPDHDLVATALEPAALAKVLGQPALAPRVLRLDPATHVGGERDFDILPNTLPPARHLAYAVQWFALALAVLATAAVLTFRKRR